MNKYRATQTIHISGWECGTEIELQMVVTYSVTPWQAQTAVCPEIPRMVEDPEVRFFLEDGRELKLPIWITDQFTDRRSFDAWLLEGAAAKDEADYIDAEEMKAEARREREWEDARRTTLSPAATKPACLTARSPGSYRSRRWPGCTCWTWTA